MADPTTISRVSLHYEYDLVVARRRARQIADALGFDAQDQTRISTVVSEMGRNALRYAGGGTVEFCVDSQGPAPALAIAVVDRGSGIPNVDEVLAGRYRSTTGMGMGIVGARRLMDEFAIKTSPEKGTAVVMKKLLPERGPAPSSQRVAEIAAVLANQRPDNPLEEIQQQNAELLQALNALQAKQDDLQRLNQELEDTNRGVLALYAELDEKAESLRKTDHLKTRFLSDMSHEFRTPVNSILALGLLLDESEMNDDQRKQVRLIRRAADDLAALVSDLLDLAKIEAGKSDVRPGQFEIHNLFSALRGMLRPLKANRAVSLVFDEPEGLPTMRTDEGKVAQILRNFISNALKFTESGEIRVSAVISADGASVVFSVADSGIGIAPEDQERIFEEFTQIDTPLQRRQKGTGLGLPLTRKLSALLGGAGSLRSSIGAGSTFTATIPIVYSGAYAVAHHVSSNLPPRVAMPAPARPLLVLVVDDDETARYTISSVAARPGLTVIEAENGIQGIAKAQSERPDVVLLDLMMPGIGGHEVLQRLKGDPVTANIPVVIVTSRFVNEEEKRQILSKAAAVIYKGDLSRAVVTRAIDDAVAAK